MVIVDAKKLKVGMVLAQPVFNLDGLLLLKEGTELTEKNILVLKSWGVTATRIEGETGDTGKQDIEECERVNASIEEEIRMKFSGTTQDKLMAEIMRIAIRLLQERYMRGRTPDETL